MKKNNEDLWKANSFRKAFRPNYEKTKEINDEWQGFTADEEKVILSDKEFMDGLNSDGVSDATINRLQKQLGYGILYGDEDELFYNAIVGLAMRETGKDWRWCEGIETCD